MKTCKHGHHDGARHRPCYQCRYEAAQREIESLREEVNAFRLDSRKLTDELLRSNQKRDELKCIADELDRRISMVYEWMQARHYHMSEPPWEKFRRDMRDIDNVDEWFNEAGRDE